MTVKMLRPKELPEVVGLSRVTIWRKVRDGTFPPPIELAENAIGWPEDIIDTWLESRPRRTYGAPVRGSD